MGISIFLSHPTPHLNKQKLFLEKIESYIKRQGLDACTMGTSNYDMDAPLAGIRRLMIGCCGLLAVAFKRARAETLENRSGADLPGDSATMLRDVWLTSPFVQIEPAMAYQLGLPILVLRERGVLAEGLLERGVTGLYCPEFDCSEEMPFELSVSKSVVDQWVGRVRNAYDSRGAPPKLY
jgi:hypothetical protein